MERLQKKQQRKQEMQEKHLKNLNLLKQRPYYDEQKDETDKKNYYKQLNIDENNPLSYESLHNLISSTYKHAKRRQNIFSIVDRQPDYSLKCIYTQQTIEDKNGVRLLDCDEEHSVPQSYQSGTKKGCGKDMHQVFAAEKHANGSRGNKPFGQGCLQHLSENIQYLQKESESGIVYKLSPESIEKAQQFPQKNIKTFYPKNNIGAVARATLYILVCYDYAMNEDKFPKNLIPFIIEQAVNQPVTLWEKHRNQELYYLQQNRNPFIDYPLWAEKIDFNKGFQQKL